MNAAATAATLLAPPPPPWELPEAIDSRADTGAGVALSIIIPTFNEAGNIEELLRRLAACLVDVTWQIVVVDDDSPDGTAHRVEQLARHDPRIRCLKRVGRRGLSSACLEGMALAVGDLIAVIDADLQHDEALLPDMLRVLSNSHCDLVVGSRYMAGGGCADWSRHRRWLSRAATTVTQRLLACALTDPMSGFFMLRRAAWRRAVPHLSDSGFKLLLDLVSSSPTPLRMQELPYTFAPRREGQSKLGAGVAWSFLRLLLRQAWRRSCGRFCQFCVIGMSGVLVHFAVLGVGLRLMGLSFPLAQTVAVLISLINNFTLNNRLTFVTSPLLGAAFATGLSRFAVVCGAGAIINVVVAQAFFQLSGWRLPAAALGIVAGAVCNYASSCAWVWRKEQSGG